MDDEYQELLERVIHRGNLLEDDIESISEIMVTRPDVARALEAQDFHLAGLVACFKIDIRKLEQFQTSTTVYFPSIREVIEDILLFVVRPIADTLDQLVDKDLQTVQERADLVVQVWEDLLNECRELGVRHRRILFEEGGVRVIQSDAPSS